MSLIITGVIDGPLSGGLPKAIELTVLHDIADLSAYGIGLASNGGASDGADFTLSGSATAGQRLYVATESTGFEAFFGFAPDFVSSVAAFNGDDALELFDNGAVIDGFGVVGEDGTGTAWEYLDGWAYRNDGATATPVFDPAEWTFSGINALDGETSNAGAATPFPVASYDAEGGGGGNGGGDATLTINEIDADTPGSDAAEFVELYDGGAGNTALDGYVVVFFNGNGDTAYAAFDLDGFSTDADGFFVLGNAGVAGAQITFAGNTLQNGADAVALYQGEASDFPVGTAATTVNLIDAVVYDTADADDTDLLAALGQTTQHDEAANGDSAGQSLSRTPDGAATIVAQAPTPGATNVVTTMPAVATIMEIQGAGHVSGFVSATPLDPTSGAGVGALVLTGGIVTAVGSNGFYMQDPAGDGDTATSDAIFVFTGAAPTVATGDAVEVEATVAEFYPGGQSTGNLPTTELTSATVTVLSSGNALPAATLIGPGGLMPPTESIDDDAFTSFDPAGDGIDFFESIEGMLVTLVEPTAISGTNRFGEIYTTVGGATGLSTRGTLNISPDDFNPERLQIDPDSTISGFSLPMVDVGSQFGDVTGVISYNFGNYELVPTEPITVLDPGTLALETSTLAGDSNQLLVASYNLLNIDPNDADGDTDIADGRFDLIAEQILNNLNAPDIIGLQEVQDGSGSTDDGTVSAALTLQTLVDAIDMANDGVLNGNSGYAWIDNTFIADNTSGGQPGANIRTAFLYRTDRVELVAGSVGTIGGQGTGEAFEGARLPLVATFLFNGEEVTLIDNHFSSKGGSSPILGVEQPFEERQDDPSVNGSVDERLAQAEAVKAYVDGLLAADPDANIVVTGDFNEFEFAPPLQTLATSLTNLTETLPEDERYSYIFDGNSQALDHILVSDGLAAGSQFDAVHLNAEFAETSTRASDHDPLLAQIAIGEAAPESILAGIELSPLGRKFTEATAFVDGTSTDEERLPLVALFQRFDDAGIRVGARGPGLDLLTFEAGSLGIRSKGELPHRGDGTLVDAGEELRFKLGGDLGDGAGAAFVFGTVEGAAEVLVSFYDDGELVETLMADISGGALEVEYFGETFDLVTLEAEGDTAFDVTAFAFDRVVDDMIFT